MDASLGGLLGETPCRCGACRPVTTRRVALDDDLARALSEVGGAMDTRERPFVFVPPDTLRMAAARYLSFSTDPAADLRRAIENGTARDEGKAKLDGRLVERIRVDPQPCSGPLCPEPPPPPIAYHVYVDSETFALVQEEWPNIVVRYMIFEYLPRTAANVALTDIRAQHPDAKEP